MSEVGIDDWEELGPPELRPVPKSRMARAVGITAGVLAGLAVLALVAWLLSGDVGGGERTVQEAPKTENTVESFVATGPTGGFSASSSDDESQAATEPLPSTVSTGWIAYRSQGAVWVAKEDGGDIRRSYESSRGVFAVSPDGKTLAVVDSTYRQLALVDVATAKVTTIGPAADEPVSWERTSAWLAYTSAANATRTVERVSREGTGTVSIGRGHAPRVSPDGHAIAFKSADENVAVSTDGGTPKQLSTGKVTDLDIGADRVYYSPVAATHSDLAIRSVRYDGTDQQNLVGTTTDNTVGSYTDLMLSPDGTLLVYSATGDDGYSKIFVVKTATGSVSLGLSKSQHTDYLLGWSKDGSKVFFIQGNALQAEKTRLMKIKSDGTNRSVLIADAGE